mmetsp:Transcript_8665/g.12940  ORF Transcript_8665/g.12940 Transcript_8665/m.12940 type:complete len:393 (-) Transcript_8665:69-1247(-)
MDSIADKFTGVYWIAVASTIFYLFLFVISVYQFLVHRKLDIQRQSNSNNFIECKLVFFATLATSALASLPLWVVCVGLGGPHDCQWNGSSYAFCWSLHLLSLTGYSCCVGIPTIMWSDIINGYNNTSFLKSFLRKDIDITRICFVSFLSCYILNELLTVLSMAIWLKPSDIGQYLDNNKIYGFNTFAEPIIIFLFAGGCLIIGTRLQIYVRSVRLEEGIERRLLWQLNTVLAIVAISYLTRAAFILNLRSHYNDNVFDCSYPVWIICTHWLPQILCSLCLLVIMSRSAGGMRPISKRRSKRRAVREDGNVYSPVESTDSFSPSGDTVKTPLIRYQGDEDDEDAEDDIDDEEEYDGYGSRSSRMESSLSSSEFHDSLHTDEVDSDYDVNIALY